MADSTVALELFLRWLNEAHERGFRLSGEAVKSPAAVAVDGEAVVAMEVRPLLGDVENAAWLGAKARLEEQLGEGLPGAYALWLPFGADLPAGEPLLSEFIDAVRQSALRLGPQERSHVPLPVRMRLRKNSDDGGVVSVTGGLNQHWARFTELVRGTYDLDSTRVHRLPESETHMEGLIEAVVQMSKQMNVGQIAEIETVDCWTIHRLNPSADSVRLKPDPRGNEPPASAGGVTVVGVPPAMSDDPGLAVRRNFRRILAASAPRLRETDAALRALVVLGPYPRIEQEGATTAMRGYEPALYSGVDFVCLVADGLVKPIIDSAV